MIEINEEQLPSIKNAKIGQTITVTIKGKVTSLREETPMDRPMEVGEKAKGKKMICAYLEPLEVNDKSFKDKDYKDLVDESTEEEESE